MDVLGIPLVLASYVDVSVREALPLLLLFRSDAHVPHDAVPLSSAIAADVDLAFERQALKGCLTVYL